jgi:Flp pilus assembly protein TadG
MGQSTGIKILGRLRSSQGTISIEVAIVSIFLVIFALIGADAGFSLYGADVNDRACRDAARAAAQTSNLTNAINKVNAILLAHQRACPFITGPVVDNVVYQDYSATPQPANSSPFVTVTTHTKINVPFSPLVFQGVSFVSPGGGFTFTQSYTFPILRVP